jgi:hypothetical protein
VAVLAVVAQMGEQGVLAVAVVDQVQQEAQELLVKDLLAETLQGRLKGGALVAEAEQMKLVTMVHPQVVVVAMAEMEKQALLQEHQLLTLAAVEDHDLGTHKPLEELEAVEMVELLECQLLLAEQIQVAAVEDLHLAPQIMQKAVDQVLL